MVNLDTTNWLLGVIAVASAVQTLMLIAVAVVGFRLYRQVSGTVEDLESRHVAPLRRQVDGVLTQVDGVLGEVHAIAARVSQQTDRVDHAINGTIERVDETAERSGTACATKCRRRRVSCEASARSSRRF